MNAVKSTKRIRTLAAIVGLTVLSSMGVRAQNSATASASASASVISADASKIITVNHNPSFGLELSSVRSSLHRSGEVATISSDLGSQSATFVADADQGYQINVSISTPDEIVALNGSGGKLRTAVAVTNLENASIVVGTHAQQSAANGQMYFSISAMAPDASAVSGGMYVGSFEVIVTYN